MSTHRAFQHRTAIRGTIPSKKSTLHMVHYRGLLQRAYVYLLEYDEQVQAYEQQPLSISYRCGHQIAQFLPDFRVFWTHQRPRLVACMREAVAHTQASRLSFAAAQCWCQQHQHDFALVTQATLQSQAVLLSNLEMLAVHAFPSIPAPTYDYLLTCIISLGEGPFSPFELVQHTPLLHPFQAKSALYHLVYHGELLTNLTKPFQFTSTPLLWKGYHAGSSTSPP